MIRTIPFVNTATYQWPISPYPYKLKRIRGYNGSATAHLFLQFHTGTQNSPNDTDISKPANTTVPLEEFPILPASEVLFDRAIDGLKDMVGPVIAVLSTTSGTLTAATAESALNWFLDIEEYEQPPDSAWTTTQNTNASAQNQIWAEVADGTNKNCLYELVLNCPSGALQSIGIDNPGYAYTAAPAMSFTGGGGGTGAAATCTIDANGRISGFTITNQGSGYTSAPTVVFTGTTGNNGVAATATAYVGNVLKIFAMNSASLIAGQIPQKTFLVPVNSTYPFRRLRFGEPGGIGYIPFEVGGVNLSTGTGPTLVGVGPGQPIKHYGCTITLESAPGALVVANQLTGWKYQVKYAALQV